MKIEQVKNFEVESIGDMSSIKAGISRESFSFLFELMSKSLYSNPIGSIIREITSNCFDSHKEANVDDPVIIKKTYDIEDDCHYIHFIDVGVGLSTDRMLKVYMNWFSSTKRDTNEQIGGFGLGSKTPLAYQDMFYITTRFNHVEYAYLLHKGETEPELESLYGYESKVVVSFISNEETGEMEEIEEIIDIPVGVDTDRRNGTEIKIAIKPNDMSAFTANMRQQLCYFDNVYVDGFQINNVYKLFQGKHFIYRDKDQYSEQMHIVLGKVAYPIDWKELKREEVKIPVGLKFEIGELVVTPNRETLRYTDEVKELLNKRIDLCIIELKELFKKENPEIGNIFKYIEVRNTRPSIKFDEETKLYLPKGIGVENSFVYSPLKDLPITIPNNPFFIYYNKFRILHGKESGIGPSIDSLLRNNVDSIYNIDNMSHKSIFKDLYIYNGYVISLEKYSYQKYCEELGLYRYVSYERYNSVAATNPFYDYVKVDNRLVKKVPLLGKAKIIKTYIDHIKSLVEPKLKSYSKLEVPEQFIREYKQRMKEESAAYKRSLNEELVVRILGQRRTVKFSELKVPAILVYGLKEDDKEIMNICNLLSGRYTFNKDRKYQDRYKQIMYISVSKANFKAVSKLPNAIHVSKVLKPNRFFKRVIRDFATSIVLNEKVSNYNNYLLDRLRPDLDYKLSLIRDFIKKNRVYHSYKNVIIELADKHKLYNEVMLGLDKELEEFFKDFDVIEYLQSNIPNKLLANIIKPYKKRVHYSIYQKQFIKGFIDPKDNLNLEQNEEENTSESES